MRVNKYAGVARFGGIGDNLIAASVCRPLKQQNYIVEVLTNHTAGVVFENNPFIDRLIMKEKLPGDNQAWQDWFMDRGIEYDKFGHLSHTCEHTLSAFPGDTLFQWPASLRRQQCGKNFLEMVHDVLEMPYQFGPLFFPTAKEEARASKTKQKVGQFVVGWGLAGTRIDKVWPHSPVAVARILKEIGPVILFGGNAKDIAMAKEIQAYVERQNKSLVGLHSAITPESSDKIEPLWPIRRGLSQAMSCDIYVGPDTGLSWACAFEDLPKIILLSHSSAENVTKHWTKTIALHADQKVVPCHPCHQLHNEAKTCWWEQDRCGLKHDEELKGAACICNIQVDLLLGAMHVALSGKAGLVEALRQSWPSNVTLSGL